MTCKVAWDPLGGGFWCYGMEASLDLLLGVASIHWSVVGWQGESFGYAS